MDHDLHVLVNSKEQLNIVNDMSQYISRVYVDSAIVQDCGDILDSLNIDVYLAGPYIFRMKDFDYFNRILEDYSFNGILVRNLETLEYMKKCSDNYDIVIDSCMYILNSDAFRFISTSYPKINEYYASQELNIHEIKDVIKGLEDYPDIYHSVIVYGKNTMMISANCIKKTHNECNHKRKFVSIKDRYKKVFPILCNCDYCYNVIYNSVPLSLHKYMNDFSNKGNFRLDFSNETANECEKTIKYFADLKNSYSDPWYSDYTTGHIKHGIE